MNKLKLKYFLLIILLSVTLPLAAQSTGSISGVVVDVKDSTSLFGAVVKIEGDYWGATTDVNGKYDIINVQPGIYAVIAVYIGYNTQKVQNVEVIAGEQTKMNFYLNFNQIGGCILEIIPKRTSGNLDMGSGKIITKDWIENSGIR